MTTDKPQPRGTPIPHREGLVSDGAGGSMTIAQWKEEQRREHERVVADQRQQKGTPRKGDSEL